LPAILFVTRTKLMPFCRLGIVAFALGRPNGWILGIRFSMNGHFWFGNEQLVTGL
jgi:hypothetical protein